MESTTGGSARPGGTLKRRALQERTSNGRRAPSRPPSERRKPPLRGFHVSGRRDLNSGPLVPQTSALTRLRHAPRREARYRGGSRHAVTPPRCWPLPTSRHFLVRQRQAPLQVGSRQAPRRGVRERPGRRCRGGSSCSGRLQQAGRLLLGFQVPLADRRCAAPTGGTHRPAYRAVSRPRPLLWPGERRLSPPRRDSEERDVARRPSAARATAPPPPA